MTCVFRGHKIIFSFQDKHKRKKKENQAANSLNTPSTDAGVIRIGHYILNETLGTGSFGKVKSKDFDDIDSHCGRTSSDFRSTSIV